MDDFTAWLRQRIQARLALARGTIELGNADVWHELSSGVLVTGDDDENHWHGTWAMGDSTLTRLMEANDPRDTIARCEAELAILDDHSNDHWCFAPGTAHYDWFLGGDCQVIRLLGSAYKHQPGYREEWAPQAAASIPARLVPRASRHEPQV